MSKKHKPKEPQYQPVVVVKGFWQGKDKEAARKFLVELGTNGINGKLTKHYR